MKRVAGLCLLLILVTVGFAPGAVAHAPAEDGQTQEPTVDGSFDSGEIGCVNGVCHNDSLDLDPSAGLSDAEFSQLVFRSKARVEKLRGERFESEVPVEVVSRDSFREENPLETNQSEAFNRWNDQVWKALFIVEETERAETEIDRTLGGAVTGFYQPTTGEITLVTDEGDRTAINERTLIHELGHALQDQRHDLTSPQFRGETQDADLAVTGVFEGEVVYLEQRYEERCEDGRWECLETPPETVTGGSENQGILQLILQPYSDGPAYISDVLDEEGWSGVDERMEEPPTTTSEIIHREPVEPTTVSVPDHSTEAWERYSVGQNGAEVAGEASVFVMLWYQATEYDADTIDPGLLHQPDHPEATRNYVSESSDGWAGDTLYPYQRGDDDGYVWATEWDTEADAAEFEASYREILAAHEANETETGIFVVDDGGFSGAYAVETDGTRVTVVHAPTTADLFELHSEINPGATNETAPGFGVGVSLAALVAIVAVSRRFHSE